MNRQIRIIALIFLALFGAVFINLNWVQLVNAGKLANNRANIRVTLRAYATERGPILTADNAEVAVSSPTPNDQYKWLRTYPLGPSYAQVTGYFSLVYGNSELESTENDKLTGSGGKLTMQSLSDQLLGNKTVGDTVVLNINNKLQQVATQALGAKKGAVVALDPNTGAILAMVSSPSYDPTLLSSHDTTSIENTWKVLQGNADKPMLNRATNQAYPPGSTFKVITAVAALQNGLGTNTTYAPVNQFLPAQTSNPIKNFGGETCGGDMTAAFTVSCNAYFAKLGDALPAGALASTAKAFGFDSNPPLEIPADASRIASDADLSSPAFTAQSAIGQYNDAATPLQMALVAAAVANKGTIMTPRLVKEVLDHQGNVIDQPKPAPWKTNVMSQQTAATMTQMMENVVNSPQGTGTAAKIPNVTVAGKTGTAQNATGAAPHAWFIAFAPAEAPQIAVAVLVENGGNLGSDATGGLVSAPIAKTIIQTDQQIAGW
ncbi:MAG TPA: penicillin-binding protein 2 [Actinomycetota bacterium]|nr:penicillin-binding protein 2 [Actinomycetota bacterium]